MRNVDTQNINAKRLKIMAKGYVKRSESGDYIGVCPKVGRERFDDLKHKLEEEGVKVSPFGISTEAFNDYIGITKEEIIEFASLGL